MAVRVREPQQTAYSILACISSTWEAAYVQAFLQMHAEQRVDQEERLRLPPHLWGTYSDPQLLYYANLVALCAAAGGTPAELVARLAHGGTSPAPLPGYLCEVCLDAPAAQLQPAPWGGTMGVCAVCMGKQDKAARMPGLDSPAS